MSTIGWSQEHEKELEARLVERTRVMGSATLWCPFCIMTTEIAKRAGRTFWQRFSTPPTHIRSEEVAYLIIRESDDGGRARFSLKYGDGTEVGVSVADLACGSAELPPSEFTRKIVLAGAGERTLAGSTVPKPVK